MKRYAFGSLALAIAMAAGCTTTTKTAMDPDVLLIDEVLAVGDANFQKKCAEWLETYRNSGGTLLFVSHNLGLVRTDDVTTLAAGPRALLVGDSHLMGVVSNADNASDLLEP